VLGASTGSLALSPQVDAKLRELMIELGMTRETIREYELGLGQKAG